MSIDALSYFVTWGRVVLEDDCTARQVAHLLQLPDGAQARGRHRVLVNCHITRLGQETRLNFVVQKYTVKNNSAAFLILIKLKVLPPCTKAAASPD